MGEDISTLLMKRKAYCTEITLIACKTVNRQSRISKYILEVHIVPLPIKS